MSKCLVLFDSDGCTAVLPTEKVDILAEKGERYDFMYRGKKHLVEVLEINDNADFLDSFERSWQSSARASVLSMRKDIAEKEGGFLSCSPVSQMMLPVVKLKRETVEPEVKEVSEQSEVNGKSRKSQPVRALRKIVTKCAKTISTKIKSLPVLPSRKVSKKVKQTGQKVENAEVMLARKRKAKGEVMPAESKKKKGTNGRTITVHYEGGMETGDYGAEPKRMPVHVEHLKDDQGEAVKAAVNLYKKNLVTTGTQTEPCIILDCDNEIKDFERNSKWLEVLTKVKEIHQAIFLSPKQDLRKELFPADALAKTSSTETCDMHILPSVDDINEENTSITQTSNTTKNELSNTQVPPQSAGKTPATISFPLTGIDKTHENVSLNKEVQPECSNPSDGKSILQTSIFDGVREQEHTNKYDSLQTPFISREQTSSTVSFPIGNLYSQETGSKHVQIHLPYSSRNEPSNINTQSSGLDRTQETLKKKVQPEWSTLSDEMTKTILQTSIFDGVNEQEHR